jgi:hypothetical protein
MCKLVVWDPLNDFRSDAAMLARLSDSTDRSNVMGSYACTQLHVL